MGGEVWCSAEVLFIRSLGVKKTASCPFCQFIFRVMHGGCCLHLRYMSWASLFRESLLQNPLANLAQSMPKERRIMDGDKRKEI